MGRQTVTRSLKPRLASLRAGTSFTMPLSEFDIIRRFFAQPELSFARPGIELAIGDDAAILSPPAGQVVTASMDLLVADVHFPAAAAPEKIAQRALAVNLSDLAAMGSEPWCFTLGLSLPQADEQWLQAFASGLSVLAQRYQCPLVGGDITRGPLSISIQVQGLNQPAAIIRRAGAKPGDKILVTGTLGNGALGLASEVGEVTLNGTTVQLQELTAEQHRLLQAEYWTPEPRVPFAMQAATHVSAGLDISDGLLGDLQHLLQASGVGAMIELEALPFAATAQEVTDVASCERAALYGGDDYELCLTAAADKLESLQQIAADLGLLLTCIGEISAEQGVRLRHRDGSETTPVASSFQHFAS